MPLQATSGAASYDAFGGGVPVVPAYIEEVFQTYLYTGNGSTQTITNGIDLSTKGGLVWLKNRTSAVQHGLTDTARGINKILYTNLTSAEGSGTWGVNSFNSTGFGITGTDSINNQTSINYASWTFRKQPKFFDVVTYTGNGSTQTINHSLGSVPGCIIIKGTNSTEAWGVYHRSIGNTGALLLNRTLATDTFYGYWNNTSPTSTQFTVGISGEVNETGKTFVAYLFAHDAGGFGLTGTDNVISCGSYTGNGSSTGPVIDLGYEPQWVLIKNTSDAYDWQLYDVMRGMSNSATGSTKGLSPNTSAAEVSRDKFVYPTATGFAIGNGTSIINQGGGTMIYIAIRRGPMKVPTSGTSVFLPTTYTSPGINVQSTVTTNFPIDLNICGARTPNSGYTYKFWFTDRLRVSSGTTTSNSLLTAGASTATETANNGLARFYFDRMTSYQITDSNGSWNGRTTSDTTFGYDLRRAPGFFDMVCYTGTGAAMNVTHNLQAVPELIIVKRRNSAENWYTYASTVGATNYLLLSSENGFSTYPIWNDTTPTSSVFSVGNDAGVSASGSTYVAYLFATCAGVSKVGSYTGNGSSQTINCGFTTGSRFVLIKRTDASGHWYVWDSARGIVAGNDPYLAFSNDQSEDFSGASDSVDTDSTGFIVNQNATNNVNVNAATYIFLAIA